MQYHIGLKLAIEKLYEVISFAENNHILLWDGLAEIYNKWSREYQLYINARIDNLKKTCNIASDKLDLVKQTRQNLECLLIDHRVSDAVLKEVGDILDIAEKRASVTIQDIEEQIKATSAPTDFTKGGTISTNQCADAPPKNDKPEHVLTQDELMHLSDFFKTLDPKEKEDRMHRNPYTEAPQIDGTEKLSFLRRLREANKERLPYFGHLNVRSWNCTDWATAVGGEVGELLNFVKKFRRGDADRDYITDIAKEMADVIIYLDFLAQWFGIDLEKAVIHKFNETSDKKNCPIKL